MEELLLKLKDKALNAKNQKDFLALTRQIIKIEELKINHEKMTELESRMEKIEQLIQDIDEAILSQLFAKGVSHDQN